MMSLPAPCNKATLWLASSVLLSMLFLLGPAEREVSAASNQMSADADGVRSGIQVTHRVQVDRTFAIGIHVADSSGPYQAYQWVLEFPSPALELRTVVENQDATGFEFCAGPAQVQNAQSPTPPIPPGHERYAGGCVGFAATEFHGQVTTMTMICHSAGVFTLHMVPGENNSEIFAPGSTTTADATVRCTGTSSGATNQMAVDADPGAAGVQGSRNAQLLTPFTIGIAITEVAEPYWGYQWDIEFSAVGLEFEGSSENTAATGFSCTGPISDEAAPPGTTRYATRCTGPSISYLGQVSTITMECQVPGQYTVHLVPVDTAVLDMLGGPATTSLTDATINCSPLP